MTLTKSQLIETIYRILGHADIRATERYQHARLEDKEAVMRK
jgi:integrase